MFEKAISNADSGPSMLHNRKTQQYSWMGLPFRGRVPALKKGDPQYRQPQYKLQVHIKQLALNIEEDMKEYEQIMQDVANQTAFISFEERIYDPDIQSWRVLLRWCDSFYEASDNEPAGMEKADE